MKIRHGWLLMLLMGAAACNSGASGQSISPTPPKPFFLSFQAYAGRAVPFAGGDQVNLAYNLLLTNYESVGLRLVSYTIGSADPSCMGFEDTYSGDSLEAMFINAGTPGSKRTSPHPPKLEASGSAVLFVFLNFASGECVPSAFSNTLVVERSDSKGSPQSLQGPNTIVSDLAAPVLNPPLRGKNWWTPNGPSNNSIHRRTLVVLNGTVYYAEEYAIDWVQLGDNGDTFSGDPHSNASYFAYLSPIYAAADGVVVSVKDGIPDNPPVQDEPLEPAVPITLDTIAGNNIVEDLGGGFFALYAHFSPGTLNVSPGQVIHAGDLLGELGNSGNSTEAHLHFQVMDAPSPLEANGLPFVLNSWTRLTYDIKRDRSGKPISLVINGSTQVVDEDFLNLDLGNF